MIDFDASTTAAICGAAWLIRSSLSKLELAVKGLSAALKGHVKEDEDKHKAGAIAQDLHAYRLDRIERLLFIPPVPGNSSGVLPDTKDTLEKEEQ